MYDHKLFVLLTLKAHFGIITPEQKETLKELQNDRASQSNYESV